MKKNRLVPSMLALTLLALHLSMARAQTLDVTLSNSTVAVTQGTTAVDFYGTITDPSTAATIFLNGDTASTSTNLLTVDDTPFFTNAPISLSPGQRSGLLELFAVDLPANTPQGIYSGNVFSILGGADGNAVDNLADVHFSVDVTARTGVEAPEIGPASAIASLTLLAGTFAVLRGGRRRFVKAPLPSSQARL
jgi:hypothetical protein